MLFTSVTFILFFLPSLIFCYFCVPKRFRGVRNFILMGFSLFFYAFGGPKYLVLMLVSVLINYLGGLGITYFKRQAQRKSILALTVIGNLVLLGWFKYAGFLSEIIRQFSDRFPEIQVILPIGISFYTFQSMSYVIDVYRTKADVQKNPLKLMLYIALFPQLIAGPIVRYTTIADEINLRHESLSDFSEGIIRFMLGFGKKMILANAAGEIADGIFASSMGTMTMSLAWVGALAYTAQIYFDFSAYSDMAIGLGRMFGFHFLENFNYPYISKSITEFWRRWHISLSSWFRDYVYIPLGGNRCTIMKNIRNISVVWLLTGLWHGAAWNFVVWGIWFCLFLLGEKFIWGEGLEKLPHSVQHLYTMLIVILSWVIFRSPDLTSAISYAGALFGVGVNEIFDGRTVYYIRQYLPEWILFGVGVFPIYNKIQKRIPLWLSAGFAFAVFFIGYLKLAVGSFNPFIYFRF
ncbi:MBOAT family O-acyltransferase [Fusibacter tunisiensis]|uniref:Alginate O-acetyltransferase complex protein AlgI n=1 Tax=Fusibacter tunisiensis TaxID=1008308 RepID=A0ABS2MTQ0_9FIRM|nr:MBOAT family O-acyltransferase [Fusibacter tunisiensis]MBM7562752.1 alginate O-acetyltransferase complex protein AlgI [Fusibacter tunisiensis]